jgi:hypothetical protein
LIARVIARLRPVAEPATWPETDSATAARTVAFHVRKSFAEKSSPVASLM